METDSPGSENLFIEHPFVLLDQELILTLPHTNGETSIHSFVPDKKHFIEDNAVWSRLEEDRARSVRLHKAWEDGPLQAYEVELISDLANEPYLAQVMQEESPGQIEIILTPLTDLVLTGNEETQPEGDPAGELEDPPFFSVEKTRLTLEGDLRAPVTAAYDFSGDAALEVLVGFVDQDSSGSGSHRISFALATGEDKKLILLDSVVEIHQHSPLRIAAGDYNGDGQSEVAVAYIDPEGRYMLAVFRLLPDGESFKLTLLSIFDLQVRLDESGGDSMAPLLDLTFVDSEGSGHERLAVAYANYDSGSQGKSNMRIIIYTLTEDKGSEEKNGLLFEGRLLRSDSKGSSPLGRSSYGDLQLVSGDMTGNGREEVVLLEAVTTIHEQEPLAPGSTTTVFGNYLFYQTPLDAKPTGWADKRWDIQSYWTAQGDPAPRAHLVSGSFTGRLNPAAGSHSHCQVLVAISHGVSGKPYADLDLTLGAYYHMKFPDPFDESKPPLIVPTFGKLDGTSLVHNKPAGPLRLAAGDLDNDSILLGWPTHIVVENQVTPLLILNEPPKHVDHNAKGEIENVSRYSEFYVAFEQVDEESESSENELTHSTSLGVSASIDVKKGVELKVAEFSMEEKITYSRSVDKKYSSIEESYKSSKVELTGETNRDDLVFFRCHTTDVWRYPILGWKRKPVIGGTEGQAFYEVVIPRNDPLDRAIHMIDGRNLDWYHPVHMNNNVLSYPASTAQLPGFEEKMLLTAPVTLGIGGGNHKSETFAWASEEKKTELESKTVKMSLDSETQFSASVKGEAGSKGAKVTVDAHYDNSMEESKSATTAVKKEKSFAIEVPAISSIYSYDISPLMLSTDGGLLKVNHVVGSIAGQLHWSRLYGSAPDPALNLPHTWRFVTVDINTEEEEWEWSGDKDSRQIRGIFFRDGRGRDLGASLPFRDPVTIAVRVHNFSLQPSPVVEVQFEASPYDPRTGEETGERILLGTVETKSSISEWGGISAAQVNWEWAELTWTPEESFNDEGNYRVHVTIDPDSKIEELPGRALGESFDNNRGWFNVFIHQPDTEREAHGTEIDLQANLSYSLQAEGEPPLTGSPVDFTGVVKNNSEDQVHEIAVFLFEGDPLDGGKAIAAKRIPGLMTGDSYSFLHTHIFDHPGQRDVHMVIYPKPGEVNHDSNSFSVGINVESPSPGRLPGDVTGSGDVTVEDAVLTMQHALNLRDDLTPEQVRAADVNEDGRVDVLDVILIVQYVLGIIDSL